jgi:hypothetical protein
MQLILYFGLHPKMAVLTNTIWKATDQMVHFLLLFGILFVKLAFLAHWMLGEKIEEFGSFPDALSSQGRMIFGEFIYASKAGDLSGARMAMYWIYAMTFMLLVFFTLLNFLLAIIVDAFVDVKEENKENQCVRHFLTDVFGVFPDLYRTRKYRWPSKSALIQFFQEFKEAHQKKHHFLKRVEEEDEDEVKVGVHVKDMIRYQFDGGKTWFDEDNAARLMVVYGGWPHLLCLVDDPDEDGKSNTVPQAADSEENPSTVIQVTPGGADKAATEQAALPSVPALPAPPQVLDLPGAVPSVPSSPALVVATAAAIPEPRVLATLADGMCMCGRVFQDSTWKFCIGCGKSRASQEQSDSCQCGFVFPDATARFCVRCGTKRKRVTDEAGVVEC